MPFQLTLAIMLVPAISYWLAIAVAARRLPRDRRRANDHRPIPGLLDPGQSHRWFGLVLSEKTAGYSTATRRAFLMARLSLLLLPVGLITAMVIAGGEP